MLAKSPFIRPCSPIISKVPPTGPGWLHEVKFDGYRCQIHKDGKQVALFSKNGNEFTSRYPAVVSAVAKLPTKAVILDAELTACAADGSPDFGALLRKRALSLCVWVFDILVHNGKDLRVLSYVERRTRLETLILRGKNPVIRYSETFPDPLPLLTACAGRGMEGIVSKRIDQPYRSGRASTGSRLSALTGAGTTSGDMSSFKSANENDRLPSCSFCGLHLLEVKRIIVGPDVYACNECVDVMHAAIHNYSPPQPPSKPRRPLAERLAEFHQHQNDQH